MGIHHYTPKKAQIIGAVTLIEKDPHSPHFKSDIFRQFGVSKRCGWEILRQWREQGRQRRHPEKETRGRKKLLTPEDLAAMEKVMWKYGYEARTLTWQALAFEAGIVIDISHQTIRKAMGTLHYRKCIACQKGWVSPSCAKRRVHDAKNALQLRPQPENWHDIRWSDEVHFSFSPKGKAYIIRKPGERYCPDCIQHLKPKKEDSQGQGRLHAWAAVGWNFKSELHFYEVPSNSNGKMTLKVYRDEILEKVVSPWLKAGEKFILEEDGDSGHGTGRQNNIARVWKEKHGLKHYFNTPGSPDLSPIENCWRAVKQYISRHRRHDSTLADLRNLAIEGWQRISQKTINNWVDSMVKRMVDVLDGKGKMTGW